MLLRALRARAARDVLPAEGKARKSMFGAAAARGVYNIVRGGAAWRRAARRIGAAASNARSRGARNNARALARRIESAQRNPSSAYRDGGAWRGGVVAHQSAIMIMHRASSS